MSVYPIVLCRFLSNNHGSNGKERDMRKMKGRVEKRIGMKKNRVKWWFIQVMLFIME